MVERRGRRGKRDFSAPRIPPSAELEPVSQLEITDHAGFCRLLIADASPAGAAAHDVVFEQCLCRLTCFNETRLRTAQCLDVLFERCEICNADWEKIHLQRVEIRRSRLTGLKLIEARIEDGVFSHCLADLSLFWSARLRSVRFDTCRLQEASFEGASLDRVTFRKCDLSGADFRGANLNAVDLRGSTIAGMQIGPKELQGVTIDPQQAVELVSLLGVVVRPLDS